jgi:hypothetical protein
MEPYELLKQATEKKKAGNLESAIRLLREAFKEITKGTTIYQVNIFLRLPMYLQEAGKGDEAWRELNTLLSSGYPNQLRNPEIIPMDQSAIYDAMRLFLQREGKNGAAVKFGVLSYISWCIGLYKQGRNDELAIYTTRENIELMMRKLLKKAKKEEVLAKISEIVVNHARRLPNIKLGELATEIDEAVLK